MTQKSLASHKILLFTFLSSKQTTTTKPRQKKYNLTTASRCRCLQTIPQLWAKASCFLDSAQPMSASMVQEDLILGQPKTLQKAIFPVKLPRSWLRFSQSCTAVWGSSYSTLWPSFSPFTGARPSSHFESFPWMFSFLLLFCISHVFSPNMFFALLTQSCLLLPRRTNWHNWYWKVVCDISE